MTCEHNFKKIYYRKRKTQEWISIPNYKVCDKCLKIVKEEVKDIGK